MGRRGLLPVMVQSFRQPLSGAIQILRIKRLLHKRRLDNLYDPKPYQNNWEKIISILQHLIMGVLMIVAGGVLGFSFG